MKKQLAEDLESGRIEGSPEWGAYGGFSIHGPCGERLIIRASAADDDDVIAQGWEHVSVSTRWRIPNWTEMCFVKDLFWDHEECVMQLHVPKSRWINNHRFCLHLWRPKRQEIPQPPDILVGVRHLV